MKSTIAAIVVLGASLIAPATLANEPTDPEVRLMPLVVNPLSDLVGSPERKEKGIALQVADKISRLYRKGFKESGKWPKPFMRENDSYFYRGSTLLGAAGRLDYYSSLKHGAFTLFLFSDGKIIGEWGWPFLDNDRVKQLPAQIYPND
ncbi:MAG: hypothetical protein AAGD22_11950 [Verrucomicrobiota bacterium]